MSPDGGSALQRPGKIIALHLNYPSRAAQRGRTPQQPSYFLKPSTSFAPSGSTVERPAGTELLGFEGEIALIIGTTARRIPIDDAWAQRSFAICFRDFATLPPASRRLVGHLQERAAASMTAA